MTTAAPNHVADAPPAWQRMDLDEFLRSGLLWRANQALWPFGVALTARTDERGQVVDLYVTKTMPFEPVVSGDEPGDEAERLERFVAWARERMTEDGR